MQSLESLAPARQNDIWTSKSGPNLNFYTFDFEVCFAPHRCTLFRHLNFQKCSEPCVFCACWLPNVLRATPACNFLSLIWPAGSAPAALASLLFDPPEPQIIGEKHSELRLSYLFAHLHLLSSLSSSSLICSLLFFSSLTLGSLTSKFRSIIVLCMIHVWSHHLVSSVSWIETTR